MIHKSISKAVAAANEGMIGDMRWAFVGAARLRSTLMEWFFSIARKRTVYFEYNKIVLINATHQTMFMHVCTKQGYAIQRSWFWNVSVVFERDVCNQSTCIF